MTRRKTKASCRDQVSVQWSKREDDLVVSWDREFGSSNPRFILDQFDTEELERRGYDITTLRFSIRKKS